MKEKTTFREPGDKSVFTVPEGYFEGLSARMNNLIDQTERQEKSRKTTMHILPGRMERFRPILYLAAMFVLLLFSISTILNLTTDKTTSTSLTKQSSTSKQAPTAEDYLISQLGTDGIAEYYIDSELYED